jgi:hypothetical protein
VRLLSVGMRMVMMMLLQRRRYLRSRHLRRSLFVCLLLACLPVPSGRVARLVSQSVYRVPAAAKEGCLEIRARVTDIL